MDDRQFNWEMLGICVNTITKLENVRKLISEKSLTLILTGEEEEIDLSEELSEEDYNAVMEITDSLIWAAISRKMVLVTEYEKKLREDVHGEFHNHKETV